jgi:hypothetical protein
MSPLQIGNAPQGPEATRGADPRQPISAESLAPGEPDDDHLEITAADIEQELDLDAEEDGGDPPQIRPTALDVQIVKDVPEWESGEYKAVDLGGLKDANADEELLRIYQAAVEDVERTEREATGRKNKKKKRWF